MISLWLLWKLPITRHQGNDCAEIAAPEMRVSGPRDEWDRKASRGGTTDGEDVCEETLRQRDDTRRRLGASGVTTSDGEVRRKTSGRIPAAAQNELLRGASRLRTVDFT